jgi:3-deoxy-D-manno-octulosonic-acid transferase
MSFLPALGTGLYHLGVRLAAPFVPKARQWVDGRKGLWQRLEARRDQLQGCLWMHCASVGEFEQGRPVLEAIKAARPDLPVLLTFFSPSGYEARKDLASGTPSGLVTHVEYLPPDSAANAQRLLQLVKPRRVLWVKYEFWPNYLHALNAAHIPVDLVSGIFRPGQPFFRWYGGAWRSMLGCFAHLFVQDEASRELLADNGITNTTVSGDTRYDRVAAIVQADAELPLATAFGGDRVVVIAGSTWPADEALLLEAFQLLGHAPKLLVVPHELDASNLRSIEQRFPKPLARWSELEHSPAESVRHTLGQESTATLLVDRMGLLARLYRHGHIAYVGGGFGDGIHSLLEAAAWGLPVLFGPRHHKFAEAQGLIDAGGGFEVRNARQLADMLEILLRDAAVRLEASEAARQHVQERVGATRTVAAHVLAEI